MPPECNAGNLQKNWIMPKQSRDDFGIKTRIGLEVPKMSERLPLTFPLFREPVHQPGQRHLQPLLPVQDGLDDVRR